MITVLLIITCLCLVGIIFCILIIRELFHYVQQVCINNIKLYDSVNELMDALTDSLENE